MVKKIIGRDKFPLFLTIIFYILLYLLRLQQVQDTDRVDKNIQIGRLTSLREIFDKKFEQFLPSPQAQLLSGIVLGEKKDLPSGLRLALRDTSTLHIVVVSGQNLSMVAGFFLALSGLIKRKLAITFSFLAIIFYTLLTGVEVPVLRAAIMVSLTFLAQIFGRQNSSLWALLATAGIMLLIKPYWLFDLSFQLSFLATMGLVVIAPIFLRHLRSLPLLGQDLAVTIGAQLMVMPVIMQNFHQASLVGVFANLLVGWTVPFMMILGTILLFLSFFSQFLATLLAIALEILLTYFIYIVQFFASLPFAWEYVGEQVWIVWVGYYMVVGGVLLALKKFLISND